MWLLGDGVFGAADHYFTDGLGLGAVGSEVGVSGVGARRCGAFRVRRKKGDAAAGASVEVVVRGRYGGRRGEWQLARNER